MKHCNNHSFRFLLTDFLGNQTAMEEKEKSIHVGDVTGGLIIEKAVAGDGVVLILN